MSPLRLVVKLTVLGMVIVFFGIAYKTWNTTSEAKIDKIWINAALMGKSQGFTMYGIQLGASCEPVKSILSQNYPITSHGEIGFTIYIGSSRTLNFFCRNGVLRKLNTHRSPKIIPANIEFDGEVIVYSGQPLGKAIDAVRYCLPRSSVVRGGRALDDFYDDCIDVCNDELTVSLDGHNGQVAYTSLSYAPRKASDK